jgi:hypothetical protein
MRVMRATRKLGTDRVSACTTPRLSIGLFHLLRFSTLANTSAPENGDGEAGRRRLTQWPTAAILLGGRSAYETRCHLRVVSGIGNRLRRP